MSAASWPDHLLTLDEWAALPEDDSRSYELVEGVLAVAPRPLPAHQRAGVRMTVLLEAQLPEELGVAPDVEVIIDAEHPPTVRAPDVVVTTEEVVRRNLPQLSAADVLLAVEVLSPGTRGTDRVMKFAEYAAAGIPHYWLADIAGTPTISAYRLTESGGYALVAEGPAPFTVAEPAPLTVDPARLIEPR